MQADFYLSTEGEYDGLAEPHPCQILERLAYEVPGDHLLIRIEPPVIGQGFGMGDKDIDQLVIGARSGGVLSSIRSWPVSVNVYRILDESVVATKTIKAGQLDGFSWGLIFRTLEEARAFLQGGQSNART